MTKLLQDKNLSNKIVKAALAFDQDQTFQQSDSPFIENTYFYKPYVNTTLSFKKEVSTYLMKSVINPDHFLKFNSANNKLNHVCMSFSKDVCFKTYLNTLSDDHLDTYIEMATDGSQRASSDRKDKLKLAEKIFATENSINLKDNFSPLTNSDVQTIKYFLKNIQCYTGIKFHLSNTHKSDIENDMCGHHISSCYTKGIYSNFGYVAYASHVVDNDLGINVDESSLLIDDDKGNSASKVNVVGFEYIVNTIGHELLHTLGLAHPKYKNLKEQLKFRSLVADDDSTESFISHDCKKKSGSNIKKYVECMNPPVDLQPIDVKGLITVWGESQDNSDYCLNLREEFYSLHKSFMQSDEA